MEMDTSNIKFAYIGQPIIIPALKTRGIYINDRKMFDIPVMGLKETLSYLSSRIKNKYVIFRTPDDLYYLVYNDFHVDFSDVTKLTLDQCNIVDILEPRAALNTQIIEYNRLKQLHTQMTGGVTLMELAILADHIRLELLS